jgi:hypothetical protein
VSAGKAKVHSDRDGRARCGHPAAREVSADREQVTCGMCLNLLAGVHGIGNRKADPEPCGTPGAYRRHLRQQGAPVRCETCLQGERRRQYDRRRNLSRAA